jgi:acylglycerol lipase
MVGVTPVEDFTLRLADGYPAHARLRRPAEAIGAVLYHHGIQSHCGWYERSAERLCAAGFAVMQFDRRGCGRNEADRGHAESADQLIRDAALAGEELLRRTGVGSYHVVGVSWGGKLAVAAYVQHSDPVLSLSLVTPGLFPRVGVSGAVMARIGFSMLYEPRKAFDIPLNDAELFTSDPGWQRFIATDRLTLRQCTAGFYLASRRMDRVVNRLAEMAAVPLHLMLAGDERIVDNDATVEFVRRLSWPDRRITWYREARHSLEFEAASGEYFSDLADFIGMANLGRPESTIG